MTDVSAINGYSSSNTLASSTNAASKQLSADMNTFLKLLTTQLQYQDPLDPMDTSEFTNQLVQYSSVEQAIQTNSKLDALLAMNQSNLGAQAVSYIGKVAQVLGDVMPLQDGHAKATYTLDKDVTSCSIMVKDMSGNVVYTENGSRTSGTHEFEWNGVNSAGQKLDDGAYQIVVTTSSPAGETAANVITTIFGKVTGVASDSDGVYIGLGDSVTSNLSDILTIRNEGYLNKDDTAGEGGEQPSDKDENNEGTVVSLLNGISDTVSDIAGAVAAFSVL